MIKWKNQQIPLLYLFLYKLMREEARNPIFISYSNVKKLLNRRLYRIPKTYHYFLLEELEEIKLIEKIGTKPSIKYKFLGGDVEKLLNKYGSIF